MVGTLFDELSYSIAEIVKETAGIGKKEQWDFSRCSAILEAENMVKKWREYMQSLFSEEDRERLAEKDAITGPSITEREVAVATWLLARTEFVD
ncbi:hypothetical protein HHI36_004391 [Cryptolaemus montrouzieri]|uniref:Uncharacterized protein n=1 Tax=Cryptolaemus montrouzieri TaxID=559131 RepID=A0ABD2NR23_9CUCU